MVNSSGKLILIIGPAGSGKSTMIKMFCDRHGAINPVSSTTRPIRRGEVEGENYYYVSLEEFEKGIKDGAFLEYALVHDKYYYGTNKKQILDILDEGGIVMREINYEGFLSLKKILGDLVKSVYILPPSIEILKRRIRRDRQFLRKLLSGE